MCLVLCISLFTKGFHTRLSFTAALGTVNLGLGELEILGLVEAGLETENFNSELISPLFHIILCVNILYMYVILHTYTHAHISAF